MVEPLESRNLLSISLPAISDVTLAAGTAVYVPLNGIDPGQTISYAVTASDYSRLAPAIMPQTNQSLQFNVDINGVVQALGFQLFDNLAPITAAHIEALVQSGFYDGLSIYRNGKDLDGNPFVIQGGNHPPSGTIKPDQPSIAEEFHPSLQFTSAGLLAMARASSPGTTAAEFFITETSTRFLDYNYSIFGVQTYGTDVIDTISAMPNQSASQDPYGLGYLVTPLTITSATIFTDTQNGVLQLRAPVGVTGTVTVTVTASDGTNAPVQQTFTVTIQADAASNPANPFAAVTPAAPASVTFLPPAGASNQVTNANNSDGSRALQFLVSGVTGGNVVQILADGRVIGQATAAGTSVTVTTNGAATLADGPHVFTAIQVAPNQTVNVVESGNLTPLAKTADVPSFSSPAVQLTVETVPPQFTSTPPVVAVVGVPYSYRAAASADSAGPATYQLTQSPEGMVINTVTGQITWTPDAGQTPSALVTVQATDVAGNLTQQQFTIGVLATNAAPVLVAAGPSAGTTDEDAAVTFDLAALINNGAATTGITDEDPDAVLGGIALVGTTGNGTWHYSLDGATFIAVGAVSDGAALLLPANAKLRYVPDGNNGETAGITYRAWDATGGAAGIHYDLTPAGLIGGAGPCSSETDTASLTMTGLNDAPVLVPAGPSFGATDFNTAIVRSLDSLVNHGSGTTAVSDVDAGAIVGSIALTGTTGAGTWEYSLDGATFTAVGVVSEVSALLLPGNVVLRYTPVAGTVETATIHYRAWDETSGEVGDRANVTENGGVTAFSSNSDAAALAVVGPNAAPVLTPAHPSLGVTVPTAGITIPLASFINTGAGTAVTDADADALVGGIALTGTSGLGTWAYSLDGTNFTAVGAVSEAAALLLPGNASLRYTPNGATAETATISYRAWDATAGTGGTYAATTATGGFTAFSTAADTASLTVAGGAISGYVYYDANNDGQKSPSEAGLPGASVGLVGPDGIYRWTQTDSAGAYLFQNLPAGQYLVQVVPSSQVTVGQSTRIVQLGVGESRGAQNFAVLGLQPSLVSLRLFLASTPPMPQIIQSMHVAPSVSLSGVEGNSNFATTYTTDAAQAAIASSAATISSPSSATLVSMTVAILNPWDGASEHLQAVTSGTSLTASYAGGVLTVSGVAEVATYQAVLRSITYSNAALPVTAAARTISVAVNDGTASSAAAVTALTIVKGAVPAGYSIAANQSTLNAATAASAGFTFAGAQVGAAFSYSVSSSGGGTPVTGGGTIASATQAVTGINLSGLPDGALTYSAALTNGAGTGAAATATATLDKTAPSGYSVVADPATLTAATASSAGFIVSGGEVGAAFSYSITSSGGGTPVTGNGTIASATQAVGGLDLSALADGTLLFSIVLTDAAGNVGAAATATASLSTPDAAVVGRLIFYNGSSFDGNDAAADMDDDNAVAVDKSALLPGGAATFANYTSYSRGINGIMVDLADAANAAAITAADFVFKAGNDQSPDGWAEAPAPVSVTVRPGAGAGGSDRITIIWADNAIENQWLQVTVKATANTGLAADDVFYFGNAIGESGDNALNTVVDARDEQAVVAHFTGGTPAAIADPCDLNRDGAVDADDAAVVQANHSGANPLVLLGRTTVFTVTAGDWTDDGLTLHLGADGLLHMYRTGTTTDAVPPVAATGIAAVQITGRDGAADVLTVDFAGGSPIPGGGLAFDGGSGGSDDTLAIADAAGSDLLAVAGAQLIVNGSSVIALANVPDFHLDLGSSTLDLGGTTWSVGNLTLVSGLITNGALSATSVDLQGGEIRVTNLATDSLTIGPGGSLVIVP